MTTNEMRQAMTTLSVFSEKERAYFQYQARKEYLREQFMIQKELKEKETALKEKAVALQQLQEAEQREKVALLEIERLKALLNKQS